MCIKHIPLSNYGTTLMYLWLKLIEYQFFDDYNYKYKTSSIYANFNQKISSEPSLTLFYHNHASCTINHLLNAISFSENSLRSIIFLFYLYRRSH